MSTPRLSYETELYTGVLGLQIISFSADSTVKILGVRDHQVCFYSFFDLIYAKLASRTPKCYPKSPSQRRYHKLGLHISTRVWRIIIEGAMSRASSFFVGLVASGLGYNHVSKKLVRPRNRLMLQHFNAEGVEPYYPHVRTLSVVLSRTPSSN